MRANINKEAKGMLNERVCTKLLKTSDIDVPAGPRNRRMCSNNNESNENQEIREATRRSPASPAPIKTIKKEKKANKQERRNKLRKNIEELPE